jgi:hypothetical protein
MEWNEVTNVDELNEYIEEHIGRENVYDEMYQDMIYGMIRNRESKKRLKKLLEDDESNTILVNP